MRSDKKVIISHFYMVIVNFSDIHIRMHTDTKACLLLCLRRFCKVSRFMKILTLLINEIFASTTVKAR